MLHHSRRTQAVAVLVAFLAFASAPLTHAAKLKPQNLTQLITAAESIIAGTVTTVTDGIDASGIPYTEITIAVGSSAKGKQKSGEEFTFRQFGLLKPRAMENGHKLLAVAPEGFARWNEGEYVVAFMYKPATRTGLQTTAGMAQGKFSVVNGQVANEFANQRLFEGVEIDPNLLSQDERDMLESRGTVDLGVFTRLVGRAVEENWIEQGLMK